MHTTIRRIITTQVDYNEFLVEHTNVPHDEKDKLMCHIKVMKIIRLALPPHTFLLVSTCKTAKEIWDRLKELYSSDIDLEPFVQTLILLEFRDFVQMSNEKLDHTISSVNLLNKKSRS